MIAAMPQLYVAYFCLVSPYESSCSKPWRTEQGQTPLHQSSADSQNKIAPAVSVFLPLQLRPSTLQWVIDKTAGMFVTLHS